MRKVKIYGLPIMIILIGIMLVFVNHIQEQLEPPSEGWSRSVPFYSLKDNINNISVFEKEDGVTLYIPGTDTVKVLSLNKNFNIVNESERNLQVASDSPIWNDGNSSFVYLRDGNLYLNSDNEEEQLNGNVKGMNALHNKVIFWTSKEVYQLDTKDFQFKLVKKFPYTIDSLVVEENTDSLLVKYSPDEKQVAVDYYYLLNDEYTRIPIFERPKSRIQNYVGLSFAEDEKKTYMIFSQVNFANGQRKFTTYYSEFERHKLNQAPLFDIVQWHDRETGTLLQQEREAILNYNQGPELWLVAKDKMTRRTDAINVYQSYLDTEENWKAEKRTKTEAISQIPFWINEHAIMWEDFNPASESERTLLVATTNPAFVENSTSITKPDVTKAFSDMLISLVSSFIILLFALCWAVLPFIFLFFVPENLKEVSPTLYSLIALCIYGIIQIISMNWILNMTFKQYAPAYINFEGSVWVVSPLLLLLSWVLMQLVKRKDWSSIQQTSYFIALNSLLVMLLFGPYII